MTAVALLAASTKAATLPDVSVGHLLEHTVVALIVIVGGIWGVQKMWARNRSRAGSRPGRTSSSLNVLSRHSLGKDQHLAVVQWGDREILVGITGSTISFYDDGAGAPMPSRQELLGTPDPDDLATISTLPPHAPRPSFASSLGTAFTERHQPTRQAAGGGTLRPVLERLRDLTERS